ncbi:MAG TPA: tRNA (guanosine(37)-N1)-methyltransferase TrmD, partial [Nitrospiraceae bacterium]|nr:tRNA (guanosine(37)-N1)-methyltransferase TrmD [Nitrospiraceae bacterium]
MRFDVITIFPEIFNAYLNESILKRAAERNIIGVTVHNLRDFTTGRHRTVDDYPYGGGPGMVMKPEPVCMAIEALRSRWPVRSPRVLLMTPQGRRFDQKMAEELAGEDYIVAVCGRYEGVDERIREHLVTDEI